jgi:hypothetical protein
MCGAQPLHALTTEHVGIALRPRQDPSCPRRVLGASVLVLLVHPPTVTSLLPQSQPPWGPVSPSASRIPQTFPEAQAHPAPQVPQAQSPPICMPRLEPTGSVPQFVKVPSSVAPSVLFDLLLTEWHLPTPNLVVSLVGEERPFAMKSWLRDVLRKGLVKAAQSTGETVRATAHPTPAPRWSVELPVTAVDISHAWPPWWCPGRWRK